jgi:glycosyltransferase involved in cell wall biosynthesis
MQEKTNINRRSGALGLSKGFQFSDTGVLVRGADPSVHASVVGESLEHAIASSAPELISVIIPTRNRAELLKRAVASVVAQDYRPIQLVVIDNASDVPVRVDSGDLDCIIHRNVSMLNLPTNRNLGVRLSSGSLVCFLDDDDSYLPRKLSMLVRALDGMDICYGNTRVVANGVTLGLSRAVGGIEQYLLYRHVHNNSTLMRKEMFEKVLFDESMTTYEDVEFITRILRQHAARHVDEVVAIWNRDGRPDQLTAPNLPRSYRNWHVLCERFAPEISRCPRLARFYYLKMCLLALSQRQLGIASRFFGRYVLHGLVPRQPS